ncbi:hypothetical protein Y1Q_0009611 [Alligator mississippiensis]|uniref:Uncharacterized protein n=1 Tax=Alligator mississippiensis TaxID=8496 RepID=A0A151NUQ3_ALLMI|nr:hypothetical protein Y1Q_0009611 [Alligator mississippiensis]
MGRWAWVHPQLDQEEGFWTPRTTLILPDAEDSHGRAVGDWYNCPCFEDIPIPAIKAVTAASIKAVELGFQDGISTWIAMGAELPKHLQKRMPSINSSLLTSGIVLIFTFNQKCSNWGH